MYVCIYTHTSMYSFVFSGRFGLRRWHWWYSPDNVGDVRELGSIPGLGISPGEEIGNPLQYSCLEMPMDGGAWWATVHGVAKSQT